MKQVVSVSLGSRHRDHEASLTLFGTPVQVARRGADGDVDEARRMMAALDGHVDAIGLGGIDRYLVVRDRRYEIQDAVRLASAVENTPVVDGSGIKNTLERTIIEQLHRDGLIHPDQSVLMVSAMDRFGMAETFQDLGYPLVAGDLIFASRINYPIRSADELEELARKLLPELTKLPFAQLYPVGAEQTVASDPKYRQYFEAASIIAGDFHYIRRYMPERLDGKVIITNTTTSADVEQVRERGARLLVTTTPVLNGRSFGTNAMEAAMVAVTGLTAEDPQWHDRVLEAGLTGTVVPLH